MAHLNACLGYFDHLRHQVLMRHLKVLLLRLLVFGCHRDERAHLERMRDILMASPSKRCWRAFLIKHLGSRLLLGRRTIVVVLHHDLGSLLLYLLLSDKILV